MARLIGVLAPARRAMLNLVGGHLATSIVVSAGSTVVAFAVRRMFPGMSVAFSITRHLPWYAFLLIALYCSVLQRFPLSTPTILP